MNLIVVPAYNEEANLPRLLADLESRPCLWEGGGRLILVDDGSRDATAGVAAAHDGRLVVDVLRAEHNEGPGRAFDRGFRHALALAGDDDLVVTLESDTTSDLDALPAMLAEAAAGADLVLASVHAGGELVNVSRFRSALSRAAGFAIRRGTGVNVRTVSSFFRVYRASLLRAGYERWGDGLIREQGFSCKAELLVKLARLDARVAEVPVALDASRRAGASKLRVIPTMRGYARLLARQLTERPERAV